MRNMFFLFIFLVMVGVSFGQEPTLAPFPPLASLPPIYKAPPVGTIAAVVKGPTEAFVGQSVFLDASASIGGKEITWKLLSDFPNVSFVPLMSQDGREIALFTAAESGTYPIILVVSEKPGVDIKVRGTASPVLITVGDATVSDIKVQDLGSNSFALVSVPVGTLAASIHTIVVSERTPPIPPEPEPEPIPEPSMAMKDIVAPIAEALNGHQEQAMKLIPLYLDMASVVERDGEGIKAIKDTRQVRDVHWRSLNLAFQGDWATRLGLKEPIDGAFEKVFGMEVVDLDDANRKKVVELCWAIAWACGEAE